MANISFSGLDELMLSMQEIAEIPDDVQDEMLNAMADVTVEAQKAEGKAMGVEDTNGETPGLMLSKIKKGKIKIRDGQRVLYITPTGTRKRGKKRVRNAEIAFINEYGKKGQKARPFIRVGNERSAEAATEAAKAVHDKWLQSKNL